MGHTQEHRSQPTIDQDCKERLTVSTSSTGEGSGGDEGTTGGVSTSSTGDGSGGDEGTTGGVSTRSTGDSSTGESAPAVDWSRFLPAVTVYVHLYGGAENTGIARVEGTGPLTEAWIRDHLSPHAKVTVRPVLDIEGQAPVDAYEIPDRHRRAVHLMTPADCFPHSSNTSRTPQIDHTIPFKHGVAAKGAGQSRVGNYGKLTITHHRIKTHTGWQVQQPFPGIYIWRDPYGALYLVDHTGTRRIDKNDAA